MGKKLDIMFTMGLAKAVYAVEFIKNPYRCIERFGSREELLDRTRRRVEMDYAE